jgi:hypothetical protein
MPNGSFQEQLPSISPPEDPQEQLLLALRGEPYSAEEDLTNRPVPNRLSDPSGGWKEVKEAIIAQNIAEKINPLFMLQPDEQDDWREFVFQHMSGSGEKELPKEGYEDLQVLGAIKLKKDGLNSQLEEAKASIEYIRSTDPTLAEAESMDAVNTAFSMLTQMEKELATLKAYENDVLQRGTIIAPDWMPGEPPPQRDRHYEDPMPEFTMPTGPSDSTGISQI